MSVKTAGQSIAELSRLRGERKFVARKYYPGAPNEDVRARCQARVDRFLDELAALRARDASKEDLLSCGKALVAGFAREDTEEREETYTYVGAAMKAVGLDDWANFI